MHCLISCVILLGSYLSQASAQDLVQDNFLVAVAEIEDRRNLYKIDLQSGAMTPLLTTNTFDISAIAFDPVERVVYWTDFKQQHIGKTNIDGSRRIPVVIFNDPDVTSCLFGLTLDTVNRKLYYTDAGNFSKIVEMNFDGSQQFSIVNETGMKPFALVVDSEKRALYYTVYGAQRGIYVIDLNTYQRTTILTAKISYPTALAIDFQERVIYWADARRSCIEMAKLDGSGRVTLVEEENVRYTAMALSPQYIYITAFDQRLRRLDRKTNVMSEQKPEVPGKLYGIVFYNSSVGRDNNNSAIQAGHTMVWILAIAVGGLVSITGMVAVSACYVAKRKRERVNAELHNMTTMDNTLTNSNEFTGDISSHNYEYIPFDITADSDGERAYADADHHYTMPVEPTLASYTTSTGTRSSNTDEFIPYATTTAAAVPKSPNVGYLDLMANDDYLEPVDGAVYNSTKDELAHEYPNVGYLDLTANEDYIKPVEGAVYYSTKDDPAQLATISNIPDANPLS